ncbi:MAG: hypothetical protein ACOX4S_01000 [Anaerovoracaceae bacterium]|jgi:hypothetical protein
MREDARHMVGLFFYINSNELDFHGWVYHHTSEEKAEKYGDFLTARMGHDQLFDSTMGKRNVDIEYFDFPRGRVVHNTVSDSHIIYVDKCIMRRMDRIVQVFKLTNYEIQEDEHYVCPNYQNAYWENN